ncbi:DUF805 domain-containing protein [Vibrio crassostreae]|uniref:DUF805 domain-containing protein n=1 Tax=Vibrio crassostreae TaxID=246167 RepID=UPI001B309A48|nr:DUF805 domain-containing protein [Vibrio crassostreae]
MNIEYIKTATRDGFTNWRDFSTRTNRKDFITFVLVLQIGFIALSLIEMLLTYSGIYLFGLPSLILFFATLPHCFSISARRLHDTGRSGWWQLLYLLPLVGLLCLSVLLILKGDENKNQYGDPSL